MRLEIDIAEHHYNNIMALDSVSLGRVPYKGIIMYSINAIKHGKVLEQEPKTGHWIPTYGNVECSVCGSVKDSRDVGKATHYCDFCGAKMVEPQESEG